MKRPLYWALGFVLLAMAAWGFWPRAIEVEVATATRGPLSETFTEEGRTRLRERYQVTAPIDGVVERISLHPGDALTSGQVVAVLRPAHAALLDPATRTTTAASWRAAREEADGAKAAAEAAAALRDRAQAALRRADALLDKRQIASDQHDDLRARAVAAEAELRGAQARLQAAVVQRDAARALLDLQGSAGQGARLELRSPVDGRLIRRFVESEGFVRAGQQLLELGDPRNLEVVVETLTSDAMRIAPGTRVRLSQWGGTAPLSGTVSVVEPGGFTKVSALGVEEQRVLVRVAVPGDIADSAQLGDAFKVEAEFLVWEADDVLRVPSAALFRDGKQWAAYVLDGARARRRLVEIGHLGETDAEVVQGLAPGTSVVLYPGDRVKDGSRVTLAD